MQKKIKTPDIFISIYYKEVNSVANIKRTSDFNSKINIKRQRK